MLKIALTGGIACGKSLVGSILTDAGISVCEADRLAHDLTEPGQPAYQRVVEAFGDGILDEAGAIDRVTLGREVFADSGRLAALNAIVHPPVRDAWCRWLEERAAQGCDMAVVTVPLLHEIRDEGAWDTVICVCASGDTQHRRLEERGLSPANAELRIASQMDVREKAVRSDYVIVNNAGIDLLRQQTTLVLESILERK